MCQNVSRLQIFQNKPSKTNKVTDVLVPRVPDIVSSYGMNFYNMQHIQLQNGIFSNGDCSSLFKNHNLYKSFF